MVLTPQTPEYANLLGITSFSNLMLKVQDEVIRTDRVCPWN
jgi:hypothetical protein